MNSKFYHTLRRVLFSTVVLLSLITIQGYAITYFTETFDGTWSGNAPAGWSYSGSAYFQRSTGGVYHYPCGYPSPQQGSAMAFFNGYNFYYTTATMISPSFNMSGAANGTISFWMYRGSGGSTYLQVQVSSDNGATWSGALATLNTGNCAWEKKYVSIPVAYRTSTVKIMLYAYSDWYYDFSIDNLVVDDSVIPMCIPGIYAYDLGGITNVTLNNLNNTTGGSYGYYDYRPTVPPANVNSGLTYTLYVTIRWTGVNYTQLVYAYIDWNKNNILNDAGEEYYLGNPYTGGTVSIAITVPITATAGLTTMRIRDMNQYVGPCGTQYGEVEDYYVNIITAATPKIQLNPASMTFNGEANSLTLPSAQTLTITNIGANSPMNWTASTIATPAPNWLTAGPPTTGTVPNVSSSSTTPIQPNRTNLAYAMPFTAYTGIARVTSPEASNSPQDINVTYNLTPPPRIDFGGTSIVMKAMFKQPPPAAKPIVVNNVGGMFNGGSMSWSVTTGTSWISFVGATNGFQGGQFKIKVDPGTMPPGTYNGSITITAANSATGTPADNSPWVVPVVLEIEDYNGGNYSGTQNITTPGNYTFNNSRGQRVFDLTLNSGSLGSFTVNMFPAQLPCGFLRMRAPHRYFTFTSTGTIYNVNLGLYYTGSEAALGGVTNPAILTVWRQNPPCGAWIDRGGTSDVLNNKVTVLSITALAGNWMPGSIWYPKTVMLRDFNLSRVGSDQVLVEWTSNLVMNNDGFIIARAPYGSELWEEIGSSATNANGSYSFIDKDVKSGVYQYQIVGYDREGTPIESQIAVMSIGVIPDKLALEQNYPNPFNPTTTITFALPENAKVTLDLFNLVGQKVASLIDGKEISAGNHSITFDASALESGTYIYRLTSNGVQLSKRMVVMK